MKRNSELRTEARASLRGKWLTSVLFVFVAEVVAIIISYGLGATAEFGPQGLVAGSSLVVMAIMIPLYYGLFVGLLRQFRGEELAIGMLFDGYNSRVWLTLILKQIYVMLWTLLLVIPGIIKSYSYAMTEYVLRDYPEVSNNKAIEMSMALMRGNKMKLFLLDLSFIGWALLAILFTLGIGMFWVAAYAYEARAAFYEDVKADMVAG